MAKKEYDKKTLMSVMDLAKYLGVANTTVSNYVARGLIPDEYTFFMGRRRFFQKKYAKQIKANIEKNLNLSFIIRERNKKGPFAEESTEMIENEPPISTPPRPDTGSSQKDAPQQTDGAMITGLNNEVIEAENLNQNKAAVEYFKGQSEKLKYQTMKKEFLPAKDVKLVWSRRETTARSRIKNLKTEVVPLVREFIPDKANQTLFMKRFNEAIDGACLELSK